MSTDIEIQRRILNGRIYALVVDIVSLENSGRYGNDVAILRAEVDKLKAQLGALPYPIDSPGRAMVQSDSEEAGGQNRRSR